MPSRHERDAAEDVLRTVRPVIHDADVPDFVRQDARDAAVLANRVLCGYYDNDKDD